MTKGVRISCSCLTYRTLPHPDPQWKAGQIERRSSRNSCLCLRCSLHRHDAHLVQRPILPHILCAQLLNFGVEVLPQNRAESVHNLLQLLEAQLLFAAAARLNVRLQHDEALVDVPVVRQQLQLLAEGRHLARQYGEDAPLLDRVVYRQVLAELGRRHQERPDRHALRALARYARVVQHVPGRAEVGVLS